MPVARMSPQSGNGHSYRIVWYMNTVLTQVKCLSLSSPSSTAGGEVTLTSTWLEPLVESSAGVTVSCACNMLVGRGGNLWRASDTQIHLQSISQGMVLDGEQIELTKINQRKQNVVWAVPNHMSKDLLDKRGKQGEW